MTRQISKLRRCSWPLLIQLAIACIPFLSISQAKSPWSIGPRTVPSVSSSAARAASFWGRYRGGSRVSQETSSTEGHAPSPPFPSHLQDDNNTATSNDNDNDGNTNQNYTTTDAVEIPEWKKQLPPPLCHKSSKTLKRICVPYQNHVAEIYLLGTAHVSNDSSRDVQLLLETLHPHVIFVELCDQRTALLEDPPQVLQNLTKQSNNTTGTNDTGRTKVPFFQKVQELQQSTNNSKFQCMATVLLGDT